VVVVTGTTGNAGGGCCGIPGVAELLAQLYKTVATLIAVSNFTQLLYCLISKGFIIHGLIDILKKIFKASKSLLHEATKRSSSLRRFTDGSSIPGSVGVRYGKRFQVSGDSY